MQGDGTLSGALAAQPGAKQQTYVAQSVQPVVMASAHYNAEIGEGWVTPTLIAHIAKDAPVMAMESTPSPAPFDDVTVIDRAAFNQVVAAAYAPHIEETDLMDTLVARGPHAVGYSQATETM